MRTVALTDQDEMEWVKAHPKAYKVIGRDFRYWVDNSEPDKAARLCVPLEYAYAIGTRSIPAPLIRAYEPVLKFYLESGLDITIRHSFAHP